MTSYLEKTELRQVLEDLAAAEFEAGIAGGSDQVAVDFVQGAARIDGHLAKPRIEQPDIRYALPVVLFELLHHSGHPVAFREDLNGKERGLEQVLRFGERQQHTNIRKTIAGGSRLGPEFRNYENLRKLASQGENQVALNQAMRQSSHVALHENAIHIFHVGIVRGVQILFDRDQRLDAHAYTIALHTAIPGEKSLSSSGNAPLAWRRAVRRSGS